jgi:hypothetical protein
VEVGGKYMMKGRNKRNPQEGENKNIHHGE